VTTRRRLLAGAAAGVFAPAVATRAAQRLLRFVPHDELTWYDPTFWPFIETRNHALMVYDTLYGSDAAGVVQPQMAEGQSVEDDGRTWRIRLREGLVFHDGTPVLARDCVASIQRWGGHAIMGKALLAATNEIGTQDDRTIVFRLTHRFPLLAAALGDRAMQVCAIMPARLTEGTDQQAIREVVGSGPFRFLAGERVPGQLQAYARHAAYVPRPSGTASFTAGPKVAHFDRVEWRIIADPEAALAALRAGEVDWWETPPGTAHAAIEADRGLALRVHDRAGYIGTMRMNHLHAPFDNPAIRRALLRAIDQDAFMEAASGSARRYRRAGVGFFAPGSPMASQAGMDALRLPPDPDGARAAVREAGYRGDPVVVLAISDLPATRALGSLGAAMLTRLGFAVETVTVPLREVVGRLLRTQPAGSGGWSVVFGYWSGLDHWHPGMHRYLRAEGRASEIGWPSSEALEALRRAWLASESETERRLIAADMQVQAFGDVPYVPLGQWVRPTAYAADLSGMLDGPPLFWNLRRG
jgi:peptide/nickel transport system substrate-binding protein